MSASILSQGKLHSRRIWREEPQNHPCAIKSNKSMCYTFKTGSEEEVSVKSPSQHSAKCNNEYWRIERPGVNQHRTSTNETSHFAPFWSATSKLFLSYRISCCVKLATSSVYKFKCENIVKLKGKTPAIFVIISFVSLAGYQSPRTYTTRASFLASRRGGDYVPCSVLLFDENVEW